MRQTLLKAAEYRSGLTGSLIISGCNNCFNSAPDIKISSHFAADRRTGFHQVIQDLVGDMLVENAFIPVRKEIEFKRFKLDD